MRCRHPDNLMFMEFGHLFSNAVARAIGSPVAAA